MGWNDHVDFDNLELIDQVVAEGELEEGTAAFGIAQLVGHEGDESLTPKQRYIYQKEICPAIARLVKQNKINEQLNMSVLD